MFEFNNKKFELIRNFKNKDEYFELIGKSVKQAMTVEQGWDYKGFYRKARKAKEYGDIYRMDGKSCVPCGGVLLEVEL